MTFPIILAHGVARFDVLANKSLKLDNNDDPYLDNLHYFKGIRTMLKHRGYDVYHSNVAWAGNLDRRAEGLREYVSYVLSKTGAAKVNIIAHSTGGLDARRMLFNDRKQGRVHDNVASLVTISTPHHGSPVADLAIKNLGVLIPLITKLGINLQAFRDLTTDACGAFNSNAAVIEFESAFTRANHVRTLAGKQKYWAVVGALKPAFRIIAKREGENDGLVSVKSAQWRDDLNVEVLDGTDHLNELGWWDPSQILENEDPEAVLRRIHHLYASVAEGLP